MQKSLSHFSPFTSPPFMSPSPIYKKNWLSLDNQPFINLKSNTMKNWCKSTGFYDKMQEKRWEKLLFVIFLHLLCAKCKQVFTKSDFRGMKRGNLRTKRPTFGIKAKSKTKNIPPGNAKGCRAVYGVDLMKEADLVMERRLLPCPIG